MTSTADALDCARDVILQKLLDELVTAAVESTTAPPGSNTTGKGAVDAVCRPSRPNASITSLKEGVDCSCDQEFGVESLEADGPADSWLVNADLSSAGTAEAARQRVICKGPSWDGFVSRMASQTAAATSQGATAVDDKQQGPAAAGLPSGAASSTNDLFPTPSRSNSLLMRRQLSKQQSSRSTSGKLLSPGDSGSSASAAVRDMGASDGATTSPLPSSNSLSRSTSVHKAKTSSSRPSLSGPDDSSAETPANSHLPAVAGATADVKSAASAPTAPAAEVESESATQTPVREPRSSGGGAAHDAENAAWMASLRKGNASGNLSRRYAEHWA